MPAQKLGCARGISCSSVQSLEFARSNCRQAERRVRSPEVRPSHIYTVISRAMIAIRENLPKLHGACVSVWPQRASDRRHSAVGPFRLFRLAALSPFWGLVRRITPRPQSPVDATAVQSCLSETRCRSPGSMTHTPKVMGV